MKVSELLTPHRFAAGSSVGPDGIPLLLAALVGLGSGGLVVLFRFSISLMHGLLWEQGMASILPLGTWVVALVPVLGGLVVGILLWGRSLLNQQGWPEDHVAVRISRLLHTLVGAAVSLGAGASLGPEGPSVELGSGVGSLVGHLLRLSPQRVTLLIGAGAAAGLAAGFNAPIAGVFLAVELVLPQVISTSTVSVVVLAAVVSALVATIGLGSEPAFSFPAYEVRSLMEMPFYLGLGVLASLVAVGFSWLLALMRLLWGRMGRVPLLLQPVLGGVLVGALGLYLPLGLGIGYETVESVLQDIPFSMAMLGSLLIGKLLMTAISQGSGFVGGIFAPSMFLGAVLGSLYGQGLALVVGTSIPLAAPPAYAMVGMAAVLAGTVRAPLTSILLLFEMTRDYRIVIPLMAAVGLSVWVRERLPVPLVYIPPSNFTSPSPTALSSLEISSPPETVSTTESPESIDPANATVS